MCLWDTSETTCFHRGLQPEQCAPIATPSSFILLCHECCVTSQARSTTSRISMKTCWTPSYIAFSPIRTIQFRYWSTTSNKRCSLHVLDHSCTRSISGRRPNCLRVFLFSLGGSTPNTKRFPRQNIGDLLALRRLPALNFLHVRCSCETKICAIHAMCTTKFVQSRLWYSPLAQKASICNTKLELKTQFPSSRQLHSHHYHFLSLCLELVHLFCSR